MIVGKKVQPPTGPALTKSFSPISSDTTQDQDVDGLLSGIGWDLTSITYSFPNSTSDYGTSINGFREFNSAQQDAVRKILGTNSEGTIFGSVSAVTLLTFAEQTGDNDGSALIRYAGRKRPMLMPFTPRRSRRAEMLGSPPLGTTTTPLSAPVDTPGSCTRPYMRLA